MSTAAEPLLTPDLLAQLERLELVSRKVFRGRLKGERRSPRKGQSVEFADFRNYVPGDDLRFIDWNLYARLDRLFLKLFLEEEDLHFYALIDASASMGFGSPSKLHFAKQLAAALGFIGLIRSDRVKVETLAQPVAAPSPALRGRASLWRLQELVSRIEVERPVTLADGIKNFCLRNPASGIVVVITDLLDKHGFEQALRGLVGRRMDTYLIHVLSGEELDPEVRGDLRLVDCEDRNEAEITVSAPLLKRYRQTLAAFLDHAREFCARRGIAYQLVDTSKVNVETLVGSYLRRRGLVR